MISNFCSTNGLHYKDNRNIRVDCLYKDGLHLLDKGKTVLDNNLESKFFNNTHAPSTRCFLNQECLSKRTSNSMEADLQILQDDRSTDITG